MKLVIINNRDLDSLEKITREKFAEVQDRPRNITEVSPAPFTKVET